MPNTAGAVGISTDVLTGIFTTATRIKVCDEKFRSLILTGQVSAQYYRRAARRSSLPRWGRCSPPTTTS